jgi:hypothetical protein
VTQNRNREESRKHYSHQENSSGESTMGIVEWIASHSEMVQWVSQATCVLAVGIIGQIVAKDL